MHIDKEFNLKKYLIIYAKIDVLPCNCLFFYLLAIILPNYVTQLSIIKLHKNAFYGHNVQDFR
jgi:hypothetical protein